MMTFLNNVALAAALLPFASGVACTHGKLYMVDDTTTNVYVMDLNGGLENFSPVAEHTLTFPEAGIGQLVLQTSGSAQHVSVIYRGNATLGYTDGYVRWIDTGVRTGGDMDVEYEADPTKIENAAFDCARAIHYVPHDNKVAIFCDGSYEEMINSTVWVIDETKFGLDGESAVTYTTTLQGSHHGVAVPVDDGHLLYSLAHENRTTRAPNAMDHALPETFQVVDYQDTVLHEIANISSKDTSCSGFHGSAAQDNTFALACDEKHGGIVIVDYDDSAAAYASRALLYPTTGGEFDGLRTGGFTEHHESEIIVGNFAARGGTSFYLLAFGKTDTALTADNALELPAAQCSYAFEMGMGKMVLVFMPTGTLHAFEYDAGTAGWNELTSATVVPNMTACSEAVFIPGVAQAFVATPANKMLYSVDLSLVSTGGDMVVHTSTLPFTPAGMKVAGLVNNHLCDGTETHAVPATPAPVISASTPAPAGVVLDPTPAPTIAITPKPTDADDSSSTKIRVGAVAMVVTGVSIWMF